MRLGMRKRRTEGDDSVNCQHSELYDATSLQPLSFVTFCVNTMSAAHSEGRLLLHNDENDVNSAYDTHTADDKKPFAFLE